LEHERGHGHDLGTGVVADRAGAFLVAGVADATPSGAARVLFSSPCRAGAGVITCKLSRCR
jgi:hypothetical protein